MNNAHELFGKSSILRAIWQEIEKRGISSVAGS